METCDWKGAKPASENTSRGKMTAIFQIIMLIVSS